MIRSIRKFLLVNLLFSIIITTALTILGNYMLDQKDIQHHLDSVLSQSALFFQALIDDEIDESKLIDIQHELNSIPDLARRHHNSIKNPFHYRYEDKFQFQIWNKNKKLLVHSVNAPLEPLSNFEIGFSRKKIKKENWLVFTTINKKNGLIVVVAEQNNIRSEFAHRIVTDDIYIMLIITPILGLLIWIIVTKGLSPLKRVTREVSHRAATYLEPVDLTEVPEEVSSLIEELNKLFKRLQKAFDREKRFSADAAHELRTPLAVLKTQAQVALRATDESQRRQALDKLIIGVDRSTHVVQQLLILARLVPDRGYNQEDINDVNLYQIAVDELIQAAPQAAEKNIDMELNCPDKLMILQGNSVALGILLRNLIDNAIRYTPEHGEVNVLIFKKQSQIILQVIDNGPGIPIELRSRVFERFYRIIGTTAKGSGLGLAIVAQILELHHAEIKLDTPISGKGLEITICFPINA